MPLTLLLVVIGTFGVFFFTGIGISLFFISRQEKTRLVYAICLAPAVGLMATNLILYPLVVYDHPVRSIGTGVFIGLLILNISLVWYEYRKDRSLFRLNISRTTIVIIFTSLIIIMIAFLLPMITGGLDHTFWQGGPWDARDFMLMGWHAQNLPWSYSANPDLYQNAIQANPALGQVIDWMNNTRATVSMSFGWVSLIFNTPISTVYYPYKLACLLIAYFATLGLAGLLNIPLRFRLAVALSVAIGYWAFYVVDVDASSQTTSIAITMVFLFSWIQLEKYNPRKLISWERLFLAFSVAAIGNAYLELLPFPLTALGLYYLLRSAVTRSLVPLGYGIRHIATFIGTIIILLPGIPYYLGFASLQFLGGRAFIGIAGPNAHYFFYWLLNRELFTKGLWGLHFYNVFSNDIFHTSIPGSIFTFLIGMPFTIILVVGMVWNYRKKADRPDIQILSTMICVFWGVALIFFATDQRWVAGKAFGYGYAFAFIAIALFIAQFLAMSRPQKLFRTMQMFVIIIFGIWTVTQATTFIFRASGARPNVDEPTDYLYLKMPGIDAIAPMLDSFKTTHPSLVMTDFGLDGDIVKHDTNRDVLDDLIIPYGWLILMQDGPEVVPLQGTGNEINLNLTWDPKWWKETNSVPDQILVAQHRDYMALLKLGKQIATSDTLALYTVTPDDFDQALAQSDILRPDKRYAVAVYGAEDPLQVASDPAYERWLVGQESRFRFIATGKSAFTLDLSFEAGFDGNVDMKLNGQTLKTIQVSKGEKQSEHLTFTPKSGTNWLNFDYSDHSSDDAVKRLLIGKFKFANIVPNS